MSRIHEAVRKAETEAGKLRTPVPNALEDALPELAVPEPSATTAAVETPELDCRHVTWRLQPNKLVFQGEAEETLASEQFRTLRSRLGNLREGNPFTSILVSSALPGEGKSFSAANLAHVLARSAQTRVVLIDADLRYSRLHELLGAPAEPGLSDLLAGNATDSEVLQTGTIPNLWFIPGGKAMANAAELLGNGKFSALMTRLSAQFDWIIVDSPALVPVSDGLLLAEMCDASLLIVRSGTTPAAAAQKAVQELRRKRLIGVLLNYVNEAQTTMYYGQSYYGGKRRAEKGQRRKG